MSGRIAVVVADDHSAFRLALVRVIDAAPDMTVVAAVGDGASALDAIRRLVPVVAVLDIRMPWLDGIDVARRLSEDQQDTRIVIATLHWDRETIQRAVAAGVSGFLSKETALSDVVEAVRAVARGQTFIAPVLADSWGPQPLGPPR